jgi:hypothetical protein
MVEDTVTERFGNGAETSQSSPSYPGAGWFPDPDKPSRRRYWDGSRWLPPAAWYPDPDNPATQRWWDGRGWRVRATKLEIAAFGTGIVGLATGLVMALIAMTYDSSPDMPNWASYTAIGCFGGVPFAIGAILLGAIGSLRGRANRYASIAIVLGAAALCVFFVGLVAALNGTSEEALGGIRHLWS